MLIKHYATLVHPEGTSFLCLVDKEMEAAIFEDPATALAECSVYQRILLKGYERRHEIYNKDAVLGKDGFKSLTHYFLCLKQGQSKDYWFRFACDTKLLDELIDLLSEHFGHNYTKVRRYPPFIQIDHNT